MWEMVARKRPFQVGRGEREGSGVERERDWAAFSPNRTVTNSLRQFWQLTQRFRTLTN